MTIDVGDHVDTVVNGKNVSGTLICNSGMGITPIDLFNDIITNESDIINLLRQCKVTPSNGIPGMIIQGKL